MSDSLYTHPYTYNSIVRRFIKGEMRTHRSFRRISSGTVAGTNIVVIANATITIAVPTRLSTYYK